MNQSNLITKNPDFKKCLQFCGHWHKEFNLVFESASNPKRPLDPSEFWKKYNYLSSTEKTKVEIIFHFWNPDNPVCFKEIIKLKDKAFLSNLLIDAEDSSNPFSQADKNKDLIRRTIFKLNLEES